MVLHENIMALTKRDIGLKVSRESGILQDTAHKAVQTVLDAIADELRKGGRVELRNFGVFEVVNRKSRIGRNPNNPGIDVKIPERNVVKFRAGGSLRKDIDK
jgi:nucleoid DNA-binding protein